MESISNIISLNKKSVVSRSERAELIKQIYEIYTSKEEKIHRKNQNWKKFIERCKFEKLDYKNKLVIETYKKSTFFIKEYDIRTFCVKTAHIPTKDLYYVLSRSKDAKNLGKSVGAWLFHAIKPD